MKESHRGRGLAVEAINKGIEDLKKRFKIANMESFYIEAIIGVANRYSINVAAKIFPTPGVPVIERETETPALQFKKLIVLRVEVQT